MSKILTEDDVKLDQQMQRSKLMIGDYFHSQKIAIDFRALWKKLENDPHLIMQFCHEIAYKKKDWRDGLRWVLDNKHSIWAYSRGEVDEHGKLRVNEQESTAATSADGKADGASVVPRGKGQPT